MAKRSNFERVEKDYYPTIDPRAAKALHPFIEGLKYVEPCYGQGHLVKLIGETAACVNHSDIDTGIDALKIDGDYVQGADVIITNPPWSRNILHPMIIHFSSLRPTWLLFDADWMHTQQSSELMKLCTDVVSVGRLIWIEGTKTSGKDNCAWYRFDIKNTSKTCFHGR